MARMELPNKGFIDVSGLVFDTPNEQMMRQLEAHINEGGWDAKPSWFVMLMKESVGLAVMDIPWFPDPLYEDPPTQLPGFSQWLEGYFERGDTDWMKKVFAQVVDPSFAGLALFVEAWSVKMPKDEVTDGSESPQEVEDRMRAYLDGKTPSQHPERVEVRVGVSYGTDGSIGMIIRERGETPMYTFFSPDEKEYAYASYGRLPESMGVLVRQIERMGKL